MTNFRESQYAANKRSALDAAVKFHSDFPNATTDAVLLTADVFLQWLEDADTGDPQ